MKFKPSGARSRWTMNSSSPGVAFKIFSASAGFQPCFSSLASALWTSDLAMMSPGLYPDRLASDLFDDLLDFGPTRQRTLRPGWPSRLAVPWPAACVAIKSRQSDRPDCGQTIHCCLSQSVFSPQRVYRPPRHGADAQIRRAWRRLPSRSSTDGGSPPLRSGFEPFLSGRPAGLPPAGDPD